MTNINSNDMLSVGTVLHGSYRIIRYLSSGGFGNTYLAIHMQLNKPVAVKEFFMRDITSRNGNNTVSISSPTARSTFNAMRDKFKKEAQRLVELHNQHIVQVYDLFDENGTSYYVMDYIDGMSLADRLKKTGIPLPEYQVLDILNQVLDALDAVHSKGFYHLDLKPANIMVDQRGKAMVIDFGASKQQLPGGGATTASGISYTNGYAPLEQMAQNPSSFGPWTDFYALGATLYKLLTNSTPPLPDVIVDDETSDKRQSLPMTSNISPTTKQLILWLMQPKHSNRPKSVNEIRSFLSSGGNGSGNDSGDGTVIDQYPPKAKGKTNGRKNKPPKPDSYLIWAILTTLLCCLPLGVYAVYCSIQVDNLYKEGDYETANESAIKAKKWSIISAAVAALCWSIVFLILIMSEGQS